MVSSFHQKDMNPLQKLGIQKKSEISRENEEEENEATLLNNQFRKT